MEDYFKPNWVDMLIASGVAFLKDALIFFGIIFVCFYLIKKFENKILNALFGKFTNATLAHFFKSIVHVGLRVLVVIVAITTVGIGTSVIFAALGSAGVAVGLALQGSLSNLASGILILTNKLYGIGDFVESNGKAGEILSIGLFYTKLLSPDGTTIYVPNANITSNNLVNYSMHDTRRLDVEFGVDYKTDVAKLQSSLKSLADRHEHILKTPAPLVSIIGFDDSSLKVRFRIFIPASMYWDIYHEIYGLVFAELKTQGIEIPYPHVVVEKKN